MNEIVSVTPETLLIDIIHVKLFSYQFKDVHNNVLRNARIEPGEIQLI